MIFFTPFYGQGSGGATGGPSVAFETTTKTVGSITGMSLILNTSYDDHTVAVSLPFTVNFLGQTYNSVHIGSNSYATFGGGSTAYSGISASNPHSAAFT